MRRCSSRCRCSGESSPFEGRHYHLARPLNNPPALRKPHPPILIGGIGERKTLRLVAKYADGPRRSPRFYVGSRAAGS